MKEKKIKGSIINISSINGSAVPTTLTSAYSSSKAAVLQLTKQLVGELSSCGIRINAISPGLIYTEMTKYGIDSSNRIFESKIPLSFIPDPEALDGTILLLASNKASEYITGANVVIDGGISWGGYHN